MLPKLRIKESGPGHHDENMRAADAFGRMLLVYALPLSLFTSTAVLPLDILLDYWPLVVVLLGATLGPYLVALLCARWLFRRPLAESVLQALGFATPSVISGLPILTSLVGDKASIVVLVGALISNIVTVPLTLVLLVLAREREPGATVGQAAIGALKHAFSQPIVWAPLLAIVVVLSGIHLPEQIVASSRLLGNTISGVALFACGVILQAQRPGFNKAAVVTTIARLLVIPGATLAMLVAIGAPHTLVIETVPALGLPAGTILVLFAMRYNAGERENAAVLLYSSLFCIPTLSLFVWIIGALSGS